MPDIQELLDQLESGNYDQVRQALDELSSFRDESIIPALARTARIKSHYNAAVHALRGFGDEKALPVLIDILDAPDPELCAGYEIVMFDTMMEQVFLDIGEPAVPPLLEALKSDDPGVRRRAAVIVSSFQSNDILPAFKEALEKETNTMNLTIFKNLIKKLEG